jgi:hypothetical protein
MTLERVDQPEPSGTNLPATRTDSRLTTTPTRRPGSGEWRQPVGVAFLPLAIWAFLVIAFAMAMWTFLATT